VTKPDHVPSLATLLLSAVCAQDQFVIEKTAAMCALLRDSEDECSEILAAVAASANAWFAAGYRGLPPAEWRLLTHLAG
jgi:hypothetical protein